MGDEPHTARGLILQNERDDPPALLGEWLHRRDIPFETAEVWRQGIGGDPSSLPWIIALGAANSVNDHEPPWIGDEIDFLRGAVRAGVPVLGICFGGQALAVALGGEVSPAQQPTVGWLGVSPDGPLVSNGPWAHFNFERFSLPPGCEPAAHSPAGPAAFRRGPHLGVQFHPEATAEIVDGWARSEAARLARHGLSPDRVRREGRLHGESAPQRAFGLFDAWWAGIPA